MLLTPELIETLAQHVSVGASIEDACGAAAIGSSSYFRWRQRGVLARKSRDAGEAPVPEDEIFVALVERIERARYEAKVEALTIIRTWALGVPQTETTTTTETREDGSVITKKVVKETTSAAWQAAAWFLERRYSAEYSLRNRLEVSGPDGGPVETTTERAERLAAEAAAYAQGHADGKAAEPSLPPP